MPRISPVADAATNSYAACFGANGLIGTNPDAGDGIFYRNSMTHIGDIRTGPATRWPLLSGREYLLNHLGPA